MVKYYNGKLYPNAKMTSFPAKNLNANKTSIDSTASISNPGPEVVNNLGSGPKGRRSKMQVKKVPFRGVF